MNYFGYKLIEIVIGFLPYYVIEISPNVVGAGHHGHLDDCPPSQHQAQKWKLVWTSIDAVVLTAHQAGERVGGKWTAAVISTWHADITDIICPRMVVAQVSLVAAERAHVVGFVLVDLLRRANLPGQIVLLAVTVRRRRVVLRRGGRSIVKAENLNAPPPELKVRPIVGVVNAVPEGTRSSQAGCFVFASDILRLLQVCVE